ncbi:MAG: DUF2256 domain-containing protein [Nanoarchaeota archaeon]
MKKQLQMKNCQTCGREIVRKYYHSQKNWEKVKFCSLKCFRHTDETIEKLNKNEKVIQNRFQKGHPAPSTAFKKGMIPWNKGLKGVMPLPWNWKGDDVKYGTLHDWVYRHLGKPTKCEFCGKKGLKSRQIHWANKSHEYKRELSDWLQLCVKCHSKYDKKG